MKYIYPDSSSSSSSSSIGKKFARIIIFFKFPIGSEYRPFIKRMLIVDIASCVVYYIISVIGREEKPPLPPSPPVSQSESESEYSESESESQSGNESESEFVETSENK